MDDELSIDRRVMIKTHFEECASCREAFQALEQVWDRLEEIPGAESDPYFYTRLQARMRSETSERRSSGLRRFIIPVTAAAAMVLGIVMGSIVGTNGQRSGALNAEDAAWAEVLELEALDEVPETTVGDVLFALASLE
jgi:hypothetical protein